MRTVWILLLFGSLITYHYLQPVSGESVPSTQPKPSFDQCKPYVDEALKTGSAGGISSSTTKGVQDAKAGDESAEDDDKTIEQDDGSKETEEDNDGSKEGTDQGAKEEPTDTNEDEGESEEDEQQGEKDSGDPVTEDGESTETEEDETESKEGSEEKDTEETESAEAESKPEDEAQTDGNTSEDSGEEDKSDGTVSDNTVANKADESESAEDEEKQETQEDQDSAEDASKAKDVDDESEEEEESKEQDGQEKESEEGDEDENATSEDKDEEGKSEEETEEDSEESEEDEDEEEVEPYIPRSRDHVTEILGLDDSDATKKTFTLLDQVTQITLKELKRIYEKAIQPLEKTYKYRDLSNRHFGDPEIFSKPLIVFMGPWSGGKSTIINWLLDIQSQEIALRTGADPSPAQFNIMMYGKEGETLDGTQLAADWTFSGLQKFGQSFLDRLRGRKLPNRLLEKVNIVEIPGILEVRKQVERSFPFNDACQWFIDRADALFLVYDPAKLDIGPETEAILDQLKGRESQVRILLNKADTVSPDELLRVQAMLMWNISPLMSSAEPPVMYAASLWDRPLKPDSPKALLTAHENNFLKDIRDGIQKQVETRIAAARRFAVRVRNHAKMVDCYLSTFHNHRSFFGDRKKVSNDIIDHPQNYHIYEGLSTLTNISRYDLPDPDTYKDFFKLNHLWDFPTLASTCGWMRGCPINKLDIAIAYELPELLGKFRRQREAVLTAQAQKANTTK